jgi:hypothetical protein
VGIVLDSSVIVAAERRGYSVREILEQVKAAQGEIEIGVSLGPGAPGFAYWYPGLGLSSALPFFWTSNP